MFSACFKMIMCFRFWCRLWLYPQIVLFSAGYIARNILPAADFYFLFNVMLWFLQVLNIWWFHFIIMLIIRVATGKAKTVEDVRSYDEKNNTSRSNGHTKMANGSLHKQQGG